MHENTVENKSDDKRWRKIPLKWKKLIKKRHVEAFGIINYCQTSFFPLETQRLLQNKNTNSILHIYSHLAYIWQFVKCLVYLFTFLFLDTKLHSSLFHSSISYVYTFLQFFFDKIIF